MILTCSNCATRYHVDPAGLGAEGRVVRCASCGHRWTAKRPADAPEAVDVEPAVPQSPRMSPLAKSRRSSPRVVAWLVAALVVLVVASAAINRNDIVALFPPSAPIYEALGLPIAAGQGLQFEQVDSKKLLEGGISVLVVEGEIVNRSEEARSVPRIRITLLDDGGRQLQRETFNSKDASLDAGAKTTFSGRLVNPPDQARNFSVTFDIGS